MILRIYVIIINGDTDKFIITNKGRLKKIKKIMKKRTILILMECDNISIKQYQLVWKYVSSARQRKAEQYRFYEDKILSVMSEFSLIYLLKQYFDIEFKRYTVQYHERGKPYFEKKEMPYFNISHTRNLVGVVVSVQNVGIDIENIKIERFERIKKLINFSFSEKECNYIALGEEGDTKRFYDIWTSREAYYKMTGEGLMLRNNNKEIPTNIDKCNMLYKNYCISICGASSEKIKVVKLNENDIYMMCQEIEKT